MSGTKASAKSARKSVADEGEAVTLETLATSLGKLPSTSAVRSLERLLEHVLWAVQQVGKSSGLDLSREAFTAARDEEKAARPKKPTPPGLLAFQARQATVKEEMTVANGGTAPSKADLSAEVKRRREAKEAPFDDEDGEAAAPAAAKAAPAAAKKPAAPAAGASKPAGKPAGKPVTGKKA